MARLDKEPQTSKPNPTQQTATPDAKASPTQRPAPVITDYASL